MLESILQSYKSVCDTKPEIMKINKNKLFDLVLDTEDDVKKDEYMSAIICKYWYQLGYLYKDNHNFLTQEECYDILINAIFTTLKYKAWRNKDNRLYKNPKGPHIALQQCIKTTTATYYILGNLDKRKIDFGVKKVSWDNLLENRKDKIYNDLKLTFDYLDSTCQLNILIKDVCKKFNVGSGIIVDIICFSNYGDYSKRKICILVRQLEQVKGDYSLYFSNKYEVDQELVKSTIEQLVLLKSYKLSSLIDKALKWVELKGGYSK